MPANSLTFDIYGSDKSASKTLVSLAKTAEETGKKVSGLSKIGGGLKSMGAGAASALSSISASSILTGITDTTKDFTDLVMSVKGIQKVTGGSVEDASHLAAQFRLSGVSAETGTKSIKKLDVALVTAAKSTATSAAMTKILGFNFKDAHGKILPMSQLMPKLADTFHNMKDGPEKVALAVKLFGKAGTDMLPMLNKGSKGLAEMSDQSDKLGLTINGSMVDSVMKARSGTRTYDAAMMGLKVTIGSQVQPIMTALAMFVTSKLVPAFVSITGWMKKHMDIVKVLAVALGVLLAGMKLMSIISSISKAFGVLNLVMSANPIGLIIVAIGALVVGFIYLWNHCKPFREFFIKLWADVKGAVEKAIKAVVAAFTNTVKAIKETWTKIGSFFSGLWGNISGWVSGLWARLGNMGSTIVHTIVRGISAVWQGIGTYFRNLWSNISGWVSGVWAGVSNFGRSIVNTIVGGIASAWQGIGTYFRNLWSNISGWVSGVWAGVSNFGRSIITTIVGGIAGAWQGIGTYFRNLWSNISGWVSGLWSALGTLGYAIVQNIWSGISGAWHWLSNFFTGLWGNITGWLGDTLSNAVQWGSDLAASILRGVGNVGTQIANQLNPFSNGGSNTIVGGGLHTGARAKGGMLNDGWTQVGEQGPEMVYTQGGKSTVYSNGRTPGGLKLGMSSPGGAFLSGGGSSSTSSRPATIVVNVSLGSGVLFGTPDQLARKLTDTITSAQQRGLVKRSPF